MHMGMNVSSANVFEGKWKRQTPPQGAKEGHFNRWSRTRRFEGATARLSAELARAH